MRISLLEKREPFYQILSDTLLNWQIGKYLSDIKMEFCVNKYLNFIAYQELSIDTFNSIFNEYSSTRGAFRSLIQKLYVYWAIYPTTRKLLSHKKISLPEGFSTFLILGGNHRLRLFTSDNKSCYILLKLGENPKFINNELILKTEFNLFYSPKVIETSEDWFKEECFNGKPLNRLNNEKRKRLFLNQIVLNHQELLIFPSVDYIPIEDYLETQSVKIQSVLNNKEILIEQNIKHNIQETFELIYRKLIGKYMVPVSWSHGDFQSGNVLIYENEFKVIDWEASDKRFWLYDFFILIGDIRTHSSFEKALNIFLNSIENFSLSKLITENWKVLLMLEELVFAIYEDCSINFFISGARVNQLSNQIKELNNK
jgi:hypothetical protein